MDQTDYVGAGDAARAAQELLSRRALRRLTERAIEALLFLSALSSVGITVGIVGILLYESFTFFEHVSIVEFLTDTQWTALFVAIPLGTIIAIYLSEYANRRLREIIKPLLELLSAVPTVVFGYFALLFVTPLLQKVLPNLSGFNMLSAGIVIGIMIVPYVSSLSEDAMKAVPVHIREGSYAMGATRLQTALRVIVPSAFSGIASAYLL